VITVGVTGGIGSGKSTFCALLQEHGAVIFHADDEAKRLMREDRDLKSEIIRAFGPDAYSENGALNRAYLADRIFSDEAARLRMNALVHPAVRRSFRQQASALREEGSVDLFVREAALLFESGTDDLDIVVVVDAPVEERITRVMARDHMTREKVLARMYSQLDTPKMRMMADYVVENTGPRASLAREVELFLTWIGERENDR